MSDDQVVDTGKALSSEFKDCATHYKELAYEDIGVAGTVSAAGNLGILASIAAIGAGGLLSITPAIVVGAPMMIAGAAGLGTSIAALTGASAYESLLMEKTAALEQHRLLSDMSERLGLRPCEIQAHYMAVHPDRPVPQTGTEILDALRDQDVLEEMRKAAYAQGERGLVQSLDKFETLEQKRLAEIAQEQKDPAAESSIPDSTEMKPPVEVHRI